MSSAGLKPYGTLPTAYGIAVPVMRRSDVPEDSPEGFVFSMDATAIMAGIHDEQDRRRFVETATKAGRAPAFEDFGGHAIPRVEIVRPKAQVYPSIPKGCDLDIPIENWITLAMDQRRWCDRADELIRIIGCNLGQAADWRDVPPEVIGLGLGQLLTATLEHLGEQDIDCVEAAALYALSMHEEWREAGVRWLNPFRRTWFRDWRRARPAYEDFARRTRAIHGDLPVWIGGRS